MVVADRRIHTIEHFSPTKKFLQAFGSSIVRMVSDTQVPNAPSGFRALSREAALRLNVLTQDTYTLETIVQAGKKNLTTAYIPITTRPQTRQLRLVRNTWSYVWRSIATILRLYTLFEPLRTFFWVSVPFFLAGGGLILRFLYFYLHFYVTEQSGVGRYVQSVVIGGTLLTLGFLFFLFGVLADLVATTRRLIEENLYRTKLLASMQLPETPIQSEERLEDGV
jgi:hypothetical protein